WAAASSCDVPVATAVAEPPQLPVVRSPSSHWGSGAMDQSPAVSSALPDSTPGAQIALGQVRDPSLRAAFHSGVYLGRPLTTSSSTSSPQNSATRRVGSSSTETSQASPRVFHHVAPACWASPANHPGSVDEKLVMWCPGCSSRTCRPTSANSSQV